MQLILGSSSPRRREILSFFDIPFTQRSPDFEEESIVFKGDPGSYVEAIAKGKLDSLARDAHPDEVLLCADTTVFCDGKIYNKPSDWDEAERFLSEIQGKWHVVYSGIFTGRAGESWGTHVATRVKLAALNPKQIAQYVKQIHALDKAAGYAVQGTGSLIVESIEGCFYNVVGMPMQALQQLLSSAGFELWDHMRERMRPT